MRTLRPLCFYFLMILAFTGLSLARERAVSNREALLTDAAMYSKSFGVDLKEAVHRLRLQGKIGQLNALLTESESGSFAGLWIEHTPVYKVVVQSTDPHAGERIREYVAGMELEKLIEMRSAAFSMEQLMSSKAAAHHLARQLGTVIESEINVKMNWVQLYSLDPDQLDARLTKAGVDLPTAVVVLPIERLSTPEVNIYGGLPISTCTSGYSVKNAGGTRGITTAAHCGNSQSYSGTALTFQSEDQEGNQDVQWHTAPGFTVTNQFDSGVGVRNCTATLSRSGQAVGNFVCKNGKTTGYTCGDISSTTYTPSYVTSAAATFIRVHESSGGNLSEGGDSGGPWFIGNTAYGTHSGSPGADPNDALYMAINYVSSLGVSVLTAP